MLQQDKLPHVNNNDTICHNEASIRFGKSAINSLHNFTDNTTTSSFNSSNIAEPEDKTQIKLTIQTEVTTEGLEIEREWMVMDRAQK